MIPVGYKFVDGVMTPMTIAEKIAAGIITEAQAEQVDIDDEIDSLENYLKDTDWYSIRYAETNAEIPQDILTARAAARTRISTLRD